MAELVPAPFPDLVTRLFREPELQDSIFELPRRKWYVPNPGDPDLTVSFHGQRAGNPLGPAAGPHTQMAQNLLLSYIAGARILELKTVQIDDHLTIGRPCIDITNVGYNIEWSQELLVEQSLREYAAGAMLIEIFRHHVAPASISSPSSPAPVTSHLSPASQPPRGDSLGPLVPRSLDPSPPVPPSSLRRSVASSLLTPYILDTSIGYNLAGIQSPKIRRFLESMRDARAEIDRLRTEIPREFRAARDHDYPTQLSTSITLSTFHGCPAAEIESICEFLVGQMNFDVIVKMNPPTLGREKLEHLLHDVLGYRHLTVNPKAYAAAISFDESLDLCDRLTAFARHHNRSLGFKFSNTLEVVNDRQFFPPNNEISYLSGQPLHVITMALTADFRRAVVARATKISRPAVAQTSSNPAPSARDLTNSASEAVRRALAIPISFSAGIDQHNFPLAVACGFVPITTSTDLLRPGGYGRLPAYLHALTAEMKKLGASNVDEYILKHDSMYSPANAIAANVTAVGDTAALSPGGAAASSPGRKPGVSGPRATPAPEGRKRAAATPQNAPSLNANPDDARAPSPIALAALHNTTHIADVARNDPRYRADRNASIPKRIDSHLTTFDCITCDKCLPVCPNAANFKYPTPLVAFNYHDLIISPDGTWQNAPETRHFEITREMQIACYADFCNECGNCDTFCPEYGGPYIQKPTFFGSLESFARAAPRDGFVLVRENPSGAVGAVGALGRVRRPDVSPNTSPDVPPDVLPDIPPNTSIRARIKGLEYNLSFEPATAHTSALIRFATHHIDATFNPTTHIPLSITLPNPLDPAHRLDLWPYHTLRHLLAGILDPRYINQVNAAFIRATPSPPDSEQYTPPVSRA